MPVNFGNIPTKYNLSYQSTKDYYWKLRVGVQVIKTTSLLFGQMPALHLNDKMTL